MSASSSTTEMASGLYVGTVRHRRHSLPAHAFHYPICLAYLDLGELEQALSGRLLWSARRAAPFRFHRADHLGDPAMPLDTAVRDLVQQRTGRRPEGPVRLLTQLRTFGYVFNPVSFYYCFGTDLRQPEALVAEVGNTPWGERHLYVLPWSRGSRRLTARHPKEFHVSPFMPMELEYRWRVTQPGDSLAVRIESLQDGRPAHDAVLALRRRPLNRATLITTTLRYPLMPMRVVAGIYAQALRLWWKGARFHPHPAGAAGGTASGNSGAAPR